MLDNVNIYFVGENPYRVGISPARVGISPSSPDAIENYHQVRKKAANKKQNGNKKAPISRGKTY